MGSRADSESYVPPGTYGMAGPMMHLCYDETEVLLHGHSDHEKEMLKRVILEHEVEFRGQVHELHRLWRVQRDLMLEYDRNPLQRNSSSPIPTNQRSMNENHSVFYSNQNRTNFEFVREGSAQSSANIVSAKKPMFDLQLPASEHIEQENGFGLGNSAVSCSSKGIAVSSANMEGNKNGRNFVSDLNQPVMDRTGFDFLGVNKDPVWHRRTDEGSSSGFLCGNKSIASEEMSFEKEKSRNSSGVHFFNPDRNPSNLASSNSSGANFFSTYGSHQNPVNDQHAIVPQLFGQRLTFSYDQPQVYLNNIFGSSYSSNNNLVAPTSFPVLDSSPHCNNLNKNKGLMEGSIHPFSPFFSSGSGAAMGGSGDNSGVFSDAHRNLIFGSSGGQSLDFVKKNWPKSFTSGMNMDLNEPIPDGNQDTKVIKLFGSSCGTLVSEANRQKNEINLNDIANEDELSQKASSSASVIAGEPKSSSVKLFGIPFFGNSSSSNKSSLHPDESSKGERKVHCEHVGPSKRVFIDLNEDLPLENDPNPSKEINEGKIPRYVIDLEMPASQFDEPDINGQQNEIEMERESGPDLSIMEAAGTIFAMSQLEKSPAPPYPESDALLWLADVIVSTSDKQVSESDSEDLFESMTLKLEEVKCDDRFGTGNFCEKKFDGESSSQAGETGYTSLLFTRGRRGPARKRRQRRDFQRDVLPTIASLSRVEVTEDLQMIGGLMRACGQDFESALTRRFGRSNSNGKGKRQQRSPQVKSPVRTPQVKQPDRNLPQTSSSQGNLSQANVPLSTPPQANTAQNPHVNPVQKTQKVSHPQRIPPVIMNQQPRAPLVNQTDGGSLLGPPKQVSPENQQPRAIQPNQPQKITLVNQAHRFTFFNQRQNASISSSHNTPPVYQPHGITEASRSGMILINNQVQRSLQNNQPQKNVPESQSQTSLEANELQRIPVASPQQAANQYSDMEGEGLSVIGWGRTTARRNRRPRGLPLAPQQQRPGNNNPAMPLK